MMRAKSHKYKKSLSDDYKHKGMRQQLVMKLRKKGISNEKVLNAIQTIPRHLFIDKAFEEKVYMDIPFSIEDGQTISHPFTVAFQTQLLEVLPSDKVLEIGTGSGYQACVLAEMGAKVYTIERQENLFNLTSQLLPLLGYGRIRTLFGDGYEGAPRFAPYDKIIVTCGAPEVPKKLLDQLRIGGKMVVPVGHGETQKMLLFTRTSDTHFTQQEYGLFSFVPFLKGINKRN